MAIIPGSVRVAGFIAPTDSTDTYATQSEEWGRGGWRTVTDIAARNAITADRRKIGMLVRVLDNGAGVEGFYTLIGGVTDDKWVEQNFGGVAPSNMATVTTADMTLYVDAVNGDDGNNGLAPGTGHALATIQIACNRIPDIINHRVVIHIAAGTYPNGFILQNKALGTFSGQASATDYTIQFVGAAHTTIDTGISTGVDSFLPKQILVDSSKDWSANSLRGKLVTIGANTYIIRRAGAASGLANDSSLEIVGIHMGALGPGVAYELKDWSTVITGANARASTNCNIILANCAGTRPTGCCVLLNNLKVVAPVSSTPGVGIQSANTELAISFCHVDVSENTTSGTNGVQIYEYLGCRIEDLFVKGLASNALGLQNGINVRCLNRVCAVKGLNGFYITSVHDVSDASYLYADDQSGYGILLTRVEYFNGNVNSIYIDGKVASNPNVVGFYDLNVSGLVILTGGIIENCKHGILFGYDTNYDTANLRPSMYSSLNVLGAITIRNCSQNGVICLGPNTMKVGSMTGICAAGSKYGFYLREGAKLFIGSGTTLTGDSGNICMDGNVLSYSAHFAANGDVAKHLDLDSLVKRID